MASRLGVVLGGTVAATAVLVWLVTTTLGTAGALVLAVVLVAAAAASGVHLGSRLSRSHRELVRRDQEMSMTASHELRTPITSLRLALEDVTLWKHTPADVSTELQRAIGELDRLSDAVTTMLDQHRAEHRGDVPSLDLSGATTTAVDRWRPTIDPSRQVRVVTRPGGTSVRTDAESVDRVLATLLDQFDGSGTGDVDVDVTPVGGTVRVQVSDHSAPRFPPGVIHGPATGKGAGQRLTLEEAGGLAESLGGYLAVADAPTTCLALILPAAP